MIRVARAMIQTASSTSECYPTAAEALWQIIHGNAIALGWPDRDRLSPNERADVLVIKPQSLWLRGDVDPLTRLVFGWDDRWIERTLVAGKVVYAAG